MYYDRTKKDRKKRRKMGRLRDREARSMYHSSDFLQKIHPQGKKQQRQTFWVLRPASSDDAVSASITVGVSAWLQGSRVQTALSEVNEAGNFKLKPMLIYHS